MDNRNGNSDDNNYKNSSLPKVLIRNISMTRSVENFQFLQLYNNQIIIKYTQNYNQ